MEQARQLAERTADAYSADNYENWTAVAAMLLRRGYDEATAEKILRSKWTRWAGDVSEVNRYGHYTSGDLARYLDSLKDEAAEVARLVAEWG